MSMSKEKKQVSFVFRGIATLKELDGDTNTVEMNKWNAFTAAPGIVIDGVNDGGFGCEKIVWAAVHVFKWFADGSEEFVETLLFTSKELQAAGK